MTKKEPTVPHVMDTVLRSFIRDVVLYRCLDTFRKFLSYLGEQVFEVGYYLDELETEVFYILQSLDHGYLPWESSEYSEQVDSPVGFEEGDSLSSHEED